MAKIKKVMGARGKKKAVSKKKIKEVKKPLRRNAKTIHKKVKEKSLYFTNRKKYFQNKKKKERKVIRKKAISTNNLYRYSVAFFNSKYDMTFRSEVYSDQPLNESSTQNQLIAFTQKRIYTLNKGLQKMFSQSAFLGLESDRVGTNDLGLSSLNRMYFYID